MGGGRGADCWCDAARGNSLMFSFLFSAQGVTISPLSGPVLTFWMGKKHKYHRDSVD